MNVIYTLQLPLLAVSVETCMLRTWPVQEGPEAEREVPEPVCLLGESGQLHAVGVLKEQCGDQRPRLQHHVLLLQPHQAKRYVIHKRLSVRHRPLGDVSERDTRDRSPTLHSTTPVQ